MNGDLFTLSLKLTHWQQLGLAFLLGSFAVATLSDLKRLRAQSEFLEVWLLFTLAILCLELYEAHAGTRPTTAVAIKWGLIAVLSLLSMSRVGILFRLATGDVIALAAAASLFTPSLILIFYLAARILAWILGPVLRRGQPYYPFMPIVTLTTLGILLLGLLI